MAISSVSNYSNIYENVYGLQKAKDKEVKEQNKSKTSEETKKQQEAGLKSGTQQEVNNQAYLNKLQKQRTHVKLEAGTGLSMKIDQKQGAVTINPKLLEKMQNDPEAEKQYTELVKNIEMAEKTVGAYYNAMGGYVERTSHWYIDENGKYTHFGYVRRDDKLNKKLREEAKKNAEKLVERSREKVAEKRKRLEEAMKKKMEEKRKEASEKEENKEITVDESESLQEPASTVDGIKQVVELLEEKHEKSMDGSVFFDTRDMQKIMDAVKGEEQEEGQEGGQTARTASRDVIVGSSVDVVI